MKTNNILWLCLLLAIRGFSQDEPNPIRLWKLTSFFGQASVRENYFTSGSALNKQSSSALTGVLSAHTKSFFIHPDFMDVTVNGTYNPSTNRSYYADVPGFPTKYQAQGIDASALFLKRKNITINTLGSFYNTYSNIENITRVRAKSKILAANLSYRNKILPFSLGYTNAKTDETVIGSNRSFNNAFETFSADANKSLTAYDNSNINYIHSISSSSEYDNGIVAFQSGNSYADHLNFNNELTFEKKRRIILTSTASASKNQAITNYNSLSGAEGLVLILPKRFTLTGGYNWGIINQGTTTIRNEGYQSSLSHRLFESLNSSIFFRENYSGQSVYKQQVYTYGLNLRYTKKIPKGMLLLGYNYTKTIETIKTPPTTLQVYREPYVLDSLKMILFTNTNVDINSVVVTDVSGTVIYTLGLDYILINHSPYLEIQHVIGSPVLHNGNTVYINYTCTKSGYFKYFGAANNLSASATLFKNLLTMYYNVSWQRFSNVINNQNGILNTYTRHVVGARINYNYISGGVEFERYMSNLLPYSGMRYFISAYKTYKKVYFSLNGNLQDMSIGDESSRRQTYSTSLNVAYTLLERINLRLNNTYSDWSMRGNKMKLFMTTFDASTHFHRFSASIGLQNYWNRSGNYIRNYKGAFIQLTRTF